MSIITSESVKARAPACKNLTWAHYILQAPQNPVTLNAPHPAPITFACVQYSYQHPAFIHPHSMFFHFYQRQSYKPIKNPSLECLGLKTKHKEIKYSEQMRKSLLLIQFKCNFSSHMLHCTVNLVSNEFSSTGTVTSKLKWWPLTL
jgi:hypothetical protein